MGPSFKVKNRFQQNESLYKMMKYEKAAIYMILIFIIIIIAFNIFGPWRRAWQPTPVFLPGESP